MAVVHRAARLLFIAEAHTAGRSTAAALQRAGGEASAKHHDRLRDVLSQGLVSSDELEELLVVSTVRNHFDALVTWWIHRGRGRAFSDFLRLLVTLPGQLRGDRLYWRCFDDSDLVLRYEHLERQLGQLMARRAGLAAAVQYVDPDYADSLPQWLTP